MKAQEYVFDRSGLRNRLFTAVAIIVTASILAAGIVAIAAFDRAVEPELANRVRMIGSTIRGEIQRALDLGIPFNSLAGVQRFLTETLENFDEVERISVTSVSGQTIASVERTGATSIVKQTEHGGAGILFRQSPFELSILQGNELVGKIIVETDPLFVQTRLRDVFLDVLVIAIVAMIVALELSLTVAISSVGKPLDRMLRLLDEQSRGDFRHRIRTSGIGGLGRTAARFNDHAIDLAERLSGISAAMRSRWAESATAKIAHGRTVRLRLSDINDIRLALFSFSVAAEIAAAFLPLYARAASRPPWLSPELAAAAPLLFYLLAVAILSPFGGRLAQRFGPRHLFLVSVPPTALALIAMGFVESITGITFWRSVMAVFYATATIACQEYALRASPEIGSARPIGAFIAVVYGGIFCGSALGGLLAGRFGYEAAFLFGAMIAILAGMQAFFAMRGRAGDPHISQNSADAPVLWNQKWFGGRFMALLVCIAIPMNASTAIFVWYLTPLMLADLGSGPAEIGRVIMLYYFAIVVFGPAVANISDNRTGPVALMMTGAFASGIALYSITFWSGFWALAVAVAGVGLSHALVRAPLYAFADTITEGSAGALSTLRLMERIGAVLGLGASALLLRDTGAISSIQILAIAVLSGVLVYGIFEVHARRTSSE